MGVFIGGAGAMAHSLHFGVGKGGAMPPDDEKPKTKYVKAHTPWYKRIIGIQYYKEVPVDDERPTDETASGSVGNEGSSRLRCSSDRALLQPPSGDDS